MRTEKVSGINRRIEVVAGFDVLAGQSAPGYG